MKRKGAVANSPNRLLRTTTSCGHYVGRRSGFALLIGAPSPDEGFRGEPNEGSNETPFVVRDEMCG